MRVAELEVDALSRDRGKSVGRGSRLGRSRDAGNAGQQFTENLGDRLDGGTVTNTNEPQLSGVSLGDTGDGVLNEGTGQTPHGTLLLLLRVVDVESKLAVVGGLEDDGGVDGDDKSSEGSLDLNEALRGGRMAGCRGGNRKFRVGDGDLVGDRDRHGADVRESRRGRRERARRRGDTALQRAQTPQSAHVGEWWTRKQMV